MAIGIETIFVHSRVSIQRVKQVGKWKWMWWSPDEQATNNVSVRGDERLHWKKTCRRYQLWNKCSLQFKSKILKIRPKRV